MGTSSLLLPLPQTMTIITTTTIRLLLLQGVMMLGMINEDQASRRGCLEGYVGAMDHENHPEHHSPSQASLLLL